MIQIKESLYKLRMNIEGLNRATSTGIRHAFYDIGKDLVADARRYIDEPKHGRVYVTRIGRGGKQLKRLGRHTASAPGEAPASITGNLKRSINFHVTGDKFLTFGVDKAQKNVKYAQYLEYSNLIAQTGQGSEKIAPRPFISRAYKENKQKIITRFQQEVARAIKK